MFQVTASLISKSAATNVSRLPRRRLDDFETSFKLFQHLKISVHREHTSPQGKASRPLIFFEASTALKGRLIPAPSIDKTIAL
jgi:hypothetical protein